MQHTTPAPSLAALVAATLLDLDTPEAHDALALLARLTPSPATMRPVTPITEDAE